MSKRQELTRLIWSELGQPLGRDVLTAYLMLTIEAAKEEIRAELDARLSRPFMSANATYVASELAPQGTRPNGQPSARLISATDVTRAPQDEPGEAGTGSKPHFCLEDGCPDCDPCQAAPKPPACDPWLELLEAAKGALRWGIPSPVEPRLPPTIPSLGGKPPSNVASGPLPETTRRTETGTEVKGTIPAPSKLCQCNYPIVNPFNFAYCMCGGRIDASRRMSELEDGWM